MAFGGKHIVRRIQRFFNYKLSVEDGLSKVTFQVPGFSYADLDRTGQVNLCSLNRLLETSRLFPHVVKNLQFIFRPSEGTVMVMLGQHLTVDPCLSKHYALDFPMELESKLVALTKSSIIKRVSLSEIKTGTVVVSALQKLVHMDLATKKSCALPQEIIDLCSNVNTTDIPAIFKQIIPQKPTKRAFTGTQTVKHSDLDYLAHTNQAAYLRFAYDCAAEAASQNAFRVIKDDVCRYQAVEASTLHMSESFAGDVLTVKVWDDDVNPYLLHCIIYKDKVGLFYVKLKLVDQVI